MIRAMGFACAVFAALGLFQVPAIARERVHYIAADEITWNYAPLGRDVIAGQPLHPLGAAQLGWIYHKAVYREYTDSTFKTLATVPVDDRYRGLVGPTIHAEVGDTIVVVFRNRTRLPVDIAPNDVVSVPKPAAVATSSTRTYRWKIGPEDGPGAGDATSILFTYASDTSQSADENAGLIGPLIIARRGNARSDGSPADVDREIVTLFSTQMEIHSPLLDENLNDRVLNAKGVRESAKFFIDANAFSSINGYVYGNMPVPVLRLHARVRWYLLSTLNDFDGHAPTWNGQTVLYNGNRSDSVSLVTSHAIVDMVPDDPGVWLLKCSNGIHLLGGMEARYAVVP